MKRRILPVIVGLLVASGFIAVFINGPIVRYRVKRIISKPDTDRIKLIPNPDTPAEMIVNGAKLEVINDVRYDAEYVSIPYPNGDVPKAQGACMVEDLPILELSQMRNIEMDSILWFTTLDHRLLWRIA